jgi:hypothetical protein
MALLSPRLAAVAHLVVRVRQRVRRQAQAGLERRLREGDASAEPAAADLRFGRVVGSE